MSIAKRWMPVLVIVMVLVVPLAAGAITTYPATDDLTDDDIATAIQRVINYLIGIGALVAVGYVVFAGFKFIFAGGDSEAAGKAKTMLWHGLLGLLIIVGAYVIVNTVLSLVGGWLGVDL